VILAVAWLAGTPSRIAHFRTSIVDDKPGTAVRRGQLAFCRRLIEIAATDVLAVGEGAMQGAWGPQWHADPRCRVIYSGIPVERLQRVEVRAPDAPVIINVGSLQPLKNQVRLIGVLRACLHAIPTVRLSLVGREVRDYGWQVRRAAAEAGVADRVHLIGEVDDPLPLIARSNLMIVPSLWEGLPGAALEACALGIPVLASDLPGTRELARHFPHLSTLPLGETDSAWADAAVRMIQRGPTNASEAEACLARSPFTLARARSAYLAIWSRNRASA
jgi:glycosyltransferase involved in cell wall biosynthesis